MPPPPPPPPVRPAGPTSNNAEDASAAAPGASGPAARAAAAAAATAGTGDNGSGGGSSSSGSGGSSSSSSSKVHHKKQAHKRYLTTGQILRRFPNEGFFVEGEAMATTTATLSSSSSSSAELRCLCTKNAVGPWDLDMVRRHVSCGTHRKMRAKVVTIPVVGDQTATIYLSSLVGACVQFVSRECACVRAREGVSE